MSKRLFIRNDDVWRLDKPFRDFFDFMYSHEIPVVYGVIPGLVDDETARFLRRAKEKAPALLDIIQHGYKHINHAPKGDHHHFEFGPTRTYDQQYHDIAEGLRIMRERFGDALTPGFIPPYHSDDENTIDAIEALGIPLYSSKTTVPRQKKFLEIPANIWANRANEDGVPWPMEFHNLARDLATVLAAGPITGIVFRHHMMVSPKDMDVLRALMQLVLRERAEGKIRTVLLSDLVNNRLEAKR